MNGYTLRPGTCDDAAAIATVQYSSWQTTYRGIGIDAWLDSVRVEDRIECWQTWLCASQTVGAMLVAEVEGYEKRETQIVGFASYGPNRDGDPEYIGELYALYLLQSVQRRGIGRALLHQVAQNLAEKALNSMLIWVLAVNPACRFYEACGGVAVRQRPFDFDGKTFDEVGYGWPDVAKVG